MTRKKSQPKIEEVSEASQNTGPLKISFHSWFQSKLQKNPRLKPWQREQLKVFMVGLNLTENEEKEKYDKAFLKF